MTSAFAPASPSSRPKSGGAGGFFGKSVEMVFAGHHTGERPARALPMVAVLGRSNVGKSSLLNALLRVKAARVSQTPGRTQALYWYRVDDRFYVVDCPGYGYAKTAKVSRILFSEMIEALLTTDPHPAALLLVDGRLEAQESDRSMALFLHETGLSTVVAATKWDAVKPSQRVRRLRELTKEYGLPDRPLQPVSSETGENLPALSRLVSAALQSRAESRSEPPRKSTAEPPDPSKEP